MKTIVEWIIVILLVVSFLCMVVFYIYIERQSKKHKYGKHFCNYCKKAFILTNEELARTHCEFCGRKLTKHEQDPDFVETEENEDDERNEENPFPDCSN